MRVGGIPLSRSSKTSDLLWRLHGVCLKAGDLGDSATSAKSTSWMALWRLWQGNSLNSCGARQSCHDSLQVSTIIARKLQHISPAPRSPRAITIVRFHTRAIGNHNTATEREHNIDCTLELGANIVLPLWDWLLIALPSSPRSSTSLPSSPRSSTSVYRSGCAPHVA